MPASRRGCCISRARRPHDLTPSWQGYSDGAVGRPEGTRRIWRRHRRTAHHRRPGQQRAAPTQDGYLKVMTTQLRPGYLRKNGVPYGAKHGGGILRQLQGTQWGRLADRHQHRERSGIPGPAFHHQLAVQEDRRSQMEPDAVPGEMRVHGAPWQVPMILDSALVWLHDTLVRHRDPRVHLGRAHHRDDPRTDADGVSRLRHSAGPAPA